MERPGGDWRTPEGRVDHGPIGYIFPVLITILTDERRVIHTIFRAPASVGGFSSLCQDYLGDFQKVRQFFRSDFRSFQRNRPRRKHRRNGHSRRETLVSVLNEQNRGFEDGEDSEHQCSRRSDDLRRRHGQQGSAEGRSTRSTRPFPRSKLADRLRNPSGNELRNGFLARG